MMFQTMLFPGQHTWPSAQQGTCVVQLFETGTGYGAAHLLHVIQFLQCPGGLGPAG